MKLKKIFLCLYICIFIYNGFSQDKINYAGDKSYSLVERTDLRKYENGKYVGLVSREIRSFIVPEKKQDKYFYEGNFYVNQDIRRGEFFNNDINSAIFSSFEIDSEGNLTMKEDNGFPTFRSFPSYPENPINLGETWTNSAIRIVDPLNKGIITKTNILVNYQYINDLVYFNQEVFVIKATWATRYQYGVEDNFDEFGDPELQKASGNHSALIYVSKQNGTALLISDNVSEYFIYKDGKKYEFKGTISLFTEYPPTVNNDKILEQITELKDITAEKTKYGLKLTLENLNFLPDSEKLVQGEEEKLKIIFNILNENPKSQILVEGHTADTNNPAGENKLSFERASTIINALSNMGISKKRFICKGSGSSKPIASNDTPEGKAKNRRVEITILE